MKSIDKSIGFIGAGIMAKAVAKSLLESGLIKPELVYVSAPSSNNFGWWKEVGATTTHNNGDIISKCEIVVLAMKPQYLENALSSIKDKHDRLFIERKLFISLLAGFSITHTKDLLVKYLGHCLDYKLQVFRVVPNTALVVGAGCTVYCTDEAEPSSNIEIVETIFKAGGVCVRVAENIVSSVSALSGSGIAYVYVMIEAMCDGAVKMGVPRQLAMQLACQTFIGGASMIKETGKHPGLLKDEVCSAGGTTIAAIHAMEKAGVRGGLIDAIEAAVKRSSELAKKDF